VDKLIDVSSRSSPGRSVEELNRTQGLTEESMEKRARQTHQLLQRRGCTTLEEIGNVLPKAVKDRELLDEISGLLDAHGMSICGDDEEKEVGERFGLTGERIRQIQNMALQPLRASGQVSVLCDFA
jgi:hypothetical protein